MVNRWVEADSKADLHIQSGKVVHNGLMGKILGKSLKFLGKTKLIDIRDLTML